MERPILGWNTFLNWNLNGLWNKNVRKLYSHAMINNSQKKNHSIWHIDNKITETKTAERMDTTWISFFFPSYKLLCLSIYLWMVISGKELTQLDVSQNQLQNVPSNAIKNLHHLLILNLNHNRISQIHNRAFEGLDTLEILTLYENKINVIEAEAFRGLEK